MNRVSKRQAGFTALEVIIIVVMAALIVLAGLWVYQHSQDEDEPAEEVEITQTQDEKEEVPAVDETEDLQTAEQYLEDLDIEGELDTKELDNTLN